MLIREEFVISCLDEAIDQYKEDILYPDLIPIEITNWRDRFQNLPADKVLQL